MTPDLDESPFPPLVKRQSTPKKVYKPGESLLRVIAPIPHYQINPLPSPIRSLSAPLFSPNGNSNGAGRSLPSPITTKDVDFSVHQGPVLLSPMSVKCDDEGPTMDLSPICEHSSEMRFSPICHQDDLKMIDIDEDEDNRLYSMHHLCEI